MNQFLRRLEVRWADLDPNFHLRHSVYYDYGATARIQLFQELGITVEFMRQHSFGPIIFREECMFKKEIKLADIVSIDVKLQKVKPDFSRWTIQHTIYKNGDIVCAYLTIDGAWMDTIKRKLTIPPPEVVKTLDIIPRDGHFDWVI
jgi:acyl-CoA thioester hydrolase